MRPRQSIAVLAAWAASAVFAQGSLVPLDPDWREDEVPAPPALRTSGLIDLEIRGSALRFGVDPASITIGKDRIVRYVVVAQNPAGGAVNGIYEGVHCAKAEVRVYARHNPGTGWVRLPDSQWQPLHEGMHARYSLPLARSGVCLGHSANGSVQQIVQDLRAPVDTRFRIETR